MSFAEFRKYLKTHHQKPEEFFDLNILTKMKEYSRISLEGVRKKINVNKKSQCFEIFGYDFIIDNDFNTWLIEVNTNPCLEESSNLLREILPRMLNDAFKLTIDSIFRPTELEDPGNKQRAMLSHFDNPYKVKGYPDHINMWQRLTTLSDRGHQRQPITPSGHKASSLPQPSEWLINQALMRNFTVDTARVLQLINQHEIKIVNKKPTAP